MKYYNPFNCPHIGKFYAKNGLTPLVFNIEMKYLKCGGFTHESPNWKYCCDCPNRLKSYPEPPVSSPFDKKEIVKGSMVGEYYEMSQKKFN